MFSIIKKMFSSEELDYSTLMEKGAAVVDVRSPSEYAGGHVKGAVNIPLGGIQSSLSKLKNKNKPVITCCRSGARSGQAASILNEAGIEAYNGGSWGQVQSAIDSL